MPLKTKDAGFRVRVEREIRQEFVELCRADGKAAAQVLREYMRDYIARNRAAAQKELFLPLARGLVPPIEQRRASSPSSLRRAKSRTRHPE
jgi:hypothetical protein